MKSLAVLHASQLVTMAGRDLGIIRDGGMLVRDGKIDMVGSSDKIDIHGAEVFDARGKVVLPGFIDAHTHLVFAGDRLDDFERRAHGESYEQIANAGGGIWSSVEKTRAASEDDLYAQAKKHAQWFLKCGTTTIEAKSGYGLTVEDELKILRVLRRLNRSNETKPVENPALAIRDSRIAREQRVGSVAKGEQGMLEIAPTFLGAHAVPRGSSENDYVDLVVEEMLPRVASEKLAEYCDVFCERGYFDVAQSRKILSAAMKLGLGLRIHADQLTNSGGAELAAELGAVTADHLEQTDERGIAAMKRAGVQPVLLPGSVYSLGSDRYPRAREMLDAGLDVVLATDFNPGSSPSPSLPMIFSIAITQMKMTPTECLTAATINAARSLGRADKIGSLEKGKVANFSIFDCEDYREMMYWFGFSQTHAVFVGGQRVYP